MKIENLRINESGFSKGKSKKLTGYPSIDKLHEKDASFLKRHPFIPSISVFNALKFMSIPYKDNYALDCLGQRMTYNELKRMAVTISKAFKELGISEKDIIPIAMPNFIQPVADYFAANRIGATTTFLNANASFDEIVYYLNLFESPVFINYNKSNEYNEKVIKATKVKSTITLKESDLNSLSFDYDGNKEFGYNNCLDYSDLGRLSKYYKSHIRTNFGGNQDSQILFTSGSTGHPKSVVLTNRNILASGIYMKNSTNVPINRGEKCLTLVPISYPYGFDTSIIMTLFCCKEAVMTPDLSPSNITEYMKKGIHYIFGSPAVYEMMMRNIGDDVDLSTVSVAISGGDTLTPKKSLEIKEFFKAHGGNTIVCNGSGNAETVATSTTAVGMAYKPETVGRPLVGTNVKIINPETLEECQYGEEGIFCVSGKHIFDRYFGDSNETSRVKFKDEKGIEWFKTDTYAVLREDGYMVIKGRDSRFFIMASGEGANFYKIYCDYVQNCISTIDVVEDCAVISQPDDDTLLSPKAYIVLKDGIKPTDTIEEYIASRCSKPMDVIGFDSKVQLKPYEIPTDFEFVDQIPKNKADKVDYKLLESITKEEYNKINSRRVKKFD